MNAKIKEHISAALAKGIRLDGRKLDEFRPISIELDVVMNAEGSAKVTCGETIILAGVKLSLGKPYPDRPDDGSLMVNAEFSPMSNPDFEMGPPAIEAIEASRVIDRGIRESNSIDTKKLCETPGEAVWVANVDIYPINYDGNFIDVGGIAAAAAISRAHMPGIKDGKTDYKNMTKDKLPFSQLPIPVTIVRIGGHLVVDPTHAEMKAAECRLTVTTIDNGDICSLQKGGDASLTLEEIDAMFDLAIKRGKEIRKTVQKACK